MSAGCFVAYVPQAARTPASEDAAFARAIAMLDHINAMGRTENAITARVTPPADAIEAAKREVSLPSYRVWKTVSRSARICRGWPNCAVAHATYADP